MQKHLIENNPVLKLTFELSLLIIGYCEELNEKRKFIVSNQLFRSGTSIGANCFEAQNAESRADFIHKMKLAAKEADETQYWLMLCESAKDYPLPGLLLEKLNDVAKVINKILATSKQNSSKIS